MIGKWNHACSRWRKKCIRQLARKYQRAQRIRSFRTCLAAAVCVEVLAGAGMFWKQNQPELSLVRREEICEVELVPKTVEHGAEAEDGGKFSGVGNSAVLEDQDIYGVRLDLKALEVQFYHRKDSVR